MSKPLRHSSNAATWKTNSTIVFLVSFVFLLLGVRASSAATVIPVLNEVFVYEGAQNIHLVALFDGPLKNSDPVLQLKNGTLSLFVQGAHAGKPLRQFFLRQGGYDRLEAREGESGLWLTIRAKNGSGGLKVIPEVTLAESSLMVRLPLLGVRENVQAYSSDQEYETQYLSDKQDSTKPAPKLTNFLSLQITPDPMLKDATSTPSASVASPQIKRSDPSQEGSLKKPLTLFNEKKRGDSKLFARPAHTNPGESLQLGSEVVSLSSVVLKFAGALAGILILIIAGMLLIKKFAPGTISRLAGHGSLVRTIYKTHLAPKQSVALVEVAGEVLVLGISGQSITMLTKIENEETLAEIRHAGQSNFMDHLSKAVTSRNEVLEKESERPQVTFKKVLGENGKRDPEQAVLSEKGADALLAYARQSAPAAKIDDEASASPQKNSQEEMEDELLTWALGSVNRLRQRLNHLPAPTGRRGMVS